MSPKFKLDAYDVKSWAITTGLLALAASITIVTEQVVDLDLGPIWGPLAVAVLGSVAKIVQKYLRGPTNETF